MSFLVVVILVITLFLLGPREKTRLWWQGNPAHDGPATARSGLSPAINLSELAAQLQQSESEIPNIIPGAEKLISFANPALPAKTACSVLYIHGFSACRQEISPVPEMVASSLKANFHATRLTGHGTSAQQLGEARPDDWIRDVIEAWNVATQLGDKVIIVATSTGATLATWMAQQPEVQAKLASLVLFAPNYRPNHKAIRLFLWPWARCWIPLITGPDYGVASTREEEARYWTAPYPVKVLFGVVGLAEAVYRSNVGSVKTPTLFIYADEDKTVYSSFTGKVMSRWGAAIVERLKEPAEPGSTNHVIAGDIFRPQSNERLVREVLGFIRNSDENS
ncbi:alpha/beta hydrolase [Reinekea marinisedimentorum]|uniref:alpha/beta hydrolase n=1 Tax=Reinekea marinisedimentorum TaxID=230495 RepID=UPI001404EB49|nr:alpha/beta fold hydrolase [Reinekea marinisedimentorum]